MIIFENVSFRYKNKEIFTNLNTMFKKNKITGLIGRNGSGKTTLLSLIKAYLLNQEGSIRYNNEIIFENKKVLEEINYINSIYPIIDGSKIKAIFKVRKIYDDKFDYSKAINYASIFNLDINLRLNSLSRGQASIYKIILALSTDTKILILDEVELGLDDNNKNLFYENLLEMQLNNPKTIIISSNVFSSTKIIFDEIKILRNYEIIEEASYEELLDKYVLIKTKNHTSNDNIITENESYTKLLINKNDINKFPNSIMEKPSLEIIYELLTRRGDNNG